MTRTKFANRAIIFDPDLSNEASHNLSNTTRCCEAAIHAGAHPVCVVSRNFPEANRELEDLGATVLRIGSNLALDPYRQTALTMPPPLDPVLDGNTSAWEQCLYVLLQMNEQIECTTDDIFFCHTVSTPLLVALLQWLLLLAPNQRPRCFLSIYTTTENMQGVPVPGVSVERILERYRECGLLGTSVFFTAEAAGLKQHYAELGFDLPILMGPVPVSTPVEKNGNDVCITYLGEAREEKGFDLVPGIIGEILKEGDSTANIRFEVQTHSSASNRTAKVERAIRDLEALASKHGNVVLHETLSADDYPKLLRSSDLTLLPYDPVAYGNRGSGVAYEALGAGNALLCSKDSDMEKTYHGEGIYVAASNTPKAFADEVRKFVSSRIAHLPKTCLVDEGGASMPEGAIPPEFPEQINKANIIRFSPENFFSTLQSIQLATKGTCPEPAAASAEVLIYVFALPHSGGHGFVQRSHLKALQAMGQRVIAIGLPWATAATGLDYLKLDFLKTYFESDEFLNVPVVFPSLRDGQDVNRFLNYVNSGQVDLFFESTFETVIGQFLEVGKIVQMAKRQSGAKKVLTNYLWSIPFVEKITSDASDIVTEVHDFQSKQNLKRRLVQNGDTPRDISEADQKAMFDRDSAFERTSLGRAGRPIFISGALKADFGLSDESTDSILRPAAFLGMPPVNASDIHQPQIDAAELGDPEYLSTYVKAAPKLRSKDIDLLFVGTGHAANVNSLRYLLDDVMPLVRAKTDCNLFVVGDIARAFPSDERKRYAQENVFFAGRSDNIEWWYSAAKVVTLCVSEGTGFPTKVIEALAAGKCFTSVASTFYELKDQAREYFDVPDDAKGVASDVLDLLSDIENRKRRGQSGNAFYTDVFGEQRYITGLASLLNLPVPDPAALPVTEAREHTEIPGAANTFFDLCKKGAEPRGGSIKELTQTNGTSWLDKVDSQYKNKELSADEKLQLIMPRWLKKPGRFEAILTDPRSLGVLALRYPTKVFRLGMIRKVRRRLIRESRKLR